MQMTVTLIITVGQCQKFLYDTEWNSTAVWQREQMWENLQATFDVAALDGSREGRHWRHR